LSVTYLVIYDEKDSIDNIKSIKYQRCPLDRKKGKDVQTPKGAQEIWPMACSPKPKPFK